MAKTAIVWQWKKNVAEYANKPGIAKVHWEVLDTFDESPVGRDGWVGIEVPYNEYGHLELTKGGE